MADEDIDVRVHLQDELSRPAARVERSIDGVKTAAAEATPVVAALGHEVDDLGDEMSQTAAKTELATKAMHRNRNAAMEDAVANLRMKQAALDAAGGKTKLLGASVKLRSLLKFALIPTILDAVGAVATLGSAVTAMAMGGIGALSPLVGLLGAVPGSLAAALQGLGVAKLATSGISDAVKNAFSPASAEQAKKFAESMKLLDPAARSFVRSLAKFKAPMKEMRTSVQNALLPSLTRLMQTFRAYMPMVNQAMTATARVLARNVAGFSRYFREASTQEKVSKILATNAEVVGKFAGIARAGLGVLLDIMVAAAPMLTRMADDALKFMQNLEFKSGRGNGLTEWFDTAYEVFKKVLKITADISMALYNIGKIGVPLGTAMGDTWMDAAKKFRHFTESAKGIERIKQWFDEMKPVIYETGRLLGAIVMGLAGLAIDKTVIDTLRSLRTDTLPTILEMVKMVSGRFIPAMAKMVGSILNIMTSTMVLPSLLEVTANALDMLAKVVAGLPKPLQTVLSILVTIAGLVKVTAFFGIAKGISGVMTTLAAKAGVAGAAYTILATDAEIATGALLMNASAATRAQAALMTTATAAKATLAPAMARLSSVLKGSVVVAFLAMVYAVVEGNNALEEMHRRSQEVRNDFAKNPGDTTFRAMIDDMNELEARVKDYESHNVFTALFDTQSWSNAWNWMTSNFGEYKSAQEQQKEEWDKSREKVEKYAKAVNTLGKHFKTTGEDIQGILEELGLDPTTTSWKKLNTEVKKYIWINRDADDATKTIYNSLKTMSDETATATEKVDAFAAALDAIQPIAKNQKQALADSARGMKGIADYAIKAAGGLPKVGKELKITTKTSDAVLDLNDALGDQVRKIDAVAAATYKETGNVNKAVAAYQNQYDTLVKQVAKGYEETGMKTDAATAAAKSLIGQYMLTPDQVKTIFKQPGMKEALDNGATLEEILKNGIPPTVTAIIKVDTARATAAIDQLNSKMNALERRSGDYVPGRWTGGPVWPDQKFTVGERGPEMFVGESGVTKVVGAMGETTTTFSEPGYIVPNHLMPDAATTTMSSGGSSSGNYMPEALPPVTVGPVYVREEIDLERAVARGIAKAKKDARERTSTRAGGR